MKNLLNYGIMKIFHEINMLGALIIVLASFSLISNDEREVVKSNNSIRLLKNGDVELLIKEYTHISGKYHITYINTLHFGEKNFYEEHKKYRSSFSNQKTNYSVCFFDK